MMLVAKACVRWWVRNFESCSKETEIIVPRCLGAYNIVREEPIQVGELIARSIKRMISSAEVYIGHPFVITTLYSRLGVPVDEGDEISPPEDTLGLTFMRRAGRDLLRVQAALQHGPPLAPQYQQHQPPPSAAAASAYTVSLPDCSHSSGTTNSF
jgi:hypothetical protein